MTNIKYPLIRVTWLDSRGVTSHWEKISEFENQHICECISVGFQIHKDENELVLASHITNTADKDDLQVTGMMYIPVAAIKESIAINIGEG